MIAAQPSGRLAGKRALVTAAARGIGRATALAFAREGASVTATDADEPALGALGDVPGLTTRRLDVLEPSMIASVAASAEFDILFNAAGWTHEGDALGTGEADWHRSFDLNVTSMYRMIRGVLPGMVARGSGAIINLGSVQSSLGSTPRRFAYGATKGAVIGLTKSVALDYAAAGIRCNAICPGAIETPSQQARIDATADPAAERALRVSRHPVGRLGQPEEVAAVAVGLASDECRFMTGAVIVIDGGYTL